MKFLKIKPLLILINITLFSSVSGNELAPYSIDYIASTIGIEAKAQRSFVLLGDNIFQVSNHLQVEMAGQIVTKMEETSTIKVLQNSFTPINYSITQTGLMEDSLTIDYDWEKRLATAINSEKISSINLKLNTFDQLSHQVALQDNILKEKTQLSFNVIDKDKIIEYKYHILGKEQIITPLGEFKSTKVERIYKEDSRQKTLFWLASDLNGILLRMSQTTSSGINIMLEIQGGTLNGTPIAASN